MPNESVNKCLINDLLMLLVQYCIVIKDLSMFIRCVSTLE